MPAGYSKTPLVKKLGIKLGFKIHFVNPPDNLQSLLGELPEKTTTIVELNGRVDYIHLFTKSKDELQTQFPIFKSGAGAKRPPVDFLA